MFFYLLIYLCIYLIIPESVWASNSGGLSNIFTSSHLLIFTSSHLHIFLSSHLLIFTPSHLHIFTSFTSSHLHIFSSLHLLIFTSSHLCIFTSSHPHIFTSHIFTSSHLHILTSSHPHIFTSSHLHIFTSSHPHILTSSHLHIFSSSHLLIFTSSHLHILSCPLALLPSCSFLLPYFSPKAGCSRWHRSLCVAGVALGDIELHFVWQVFSFIDSLLTRSCFTTFSCPATFWQTASESFLLALVSLLDFSASSMASSRSALAAAMWSFALLAFSGRFFHSSSSVGFSSRAHSLSIMARRPFLPVPFLPPTPLPKPFVSPGSCFL